MAQTATAIIVYIFFNVISLSLLPSTSSSFTLKLTHRDSPLSPLYEPNLSDLQRLTKHVEISTARASYLQRLIDDDNGDSNALQKVWMRLPSKAHDPIFTVEIGIGTPPVKKTLIFDTGNGLTWTQCKPCLKCFKQDEPLFDPKNSSSYKRMPKKHPFAKSFTCPLFGRSCSYQIRYFGDRVFSAGVAAMETFTFQSNIAGSTTRVLNLVFGCGTKSFGNFPNTKVSGLLGFNREPYSFARQLGSSINGRFSYCLPYGPGARASYVRFGDEAAVRGRNAQKTPFLNTNHSRILYGLNLLDLSINGQKLGLGQRAFPQGCFIDSGASVGRLNVRAFSAVVGFLDRYFSQFRGIGRYEGHLAPNTLHCYTRPQGFMKYPSMTFHLQGADYYVSQQNLFFFLEGGGERAFCLSMMESKDTTMYLGAHQQMNVRIVYDLKEGMLSFAPEDCSRDAASLI